MNTTACNGTVIEDSWEACLMGDSGFLCCEPQNNVKTCEAKGIAGTCMVNTTRCGGSATLTAYNNICEDGYDCCVQLPPPHTSSGNSALSGGGAPTASRLVVSVALVLCTMVFW